MPTEPTSDSDAPVHFIEQIVRDDIAAGKHGGAVVTRFPPEPNGYLHIGHAKAICLNFGIAAAHGGLCNLRFDDTNPTREEQEFVDAIQQDVRWLGFDWEDRLYFTSSYFEQLHDWAVQLIESGDAYVDDQDAAEIRRRRGTLTEPGEASPFRKRTVEENLDLFRRMREGEFPDGSCVLRAKIEMASGNLNLRDPVMYRILHATHHRTGDAWCIYPMYDWAHGQSDSIEKVTHSLCTLEFEDHRPLYDWYVEKLGIHAPRQIEFARLNMTYTVLSKRKLLRLVQEGHVTGWGDPRMPTLSGMRRRGFPATAIRNFCSDIGMAKRDSRVSVAQLEYSVRDELNRIAPRVMAVLDPIRVVIENYPEGQVEQMEAVNNPEDPAAGKRTVPFSRELYVERNDFREDPPRKFHRLGPGREVRLRYGYFITCRDVVKNDAGDVVELRCTYDPETRGGQAPDGRKVRGTIHWVSVEHAIEAEVRLYDRLFHREKPDSTGEGEDFTANLNPDSLSVIPRALLEPSMADAEAGVTYQFERLGYFCLDADDRAGARVFNRTITLRDTWARIEKALR